MYWVNRADYVGVCTSISETCKNVKLSQKKLFSSLYYVTFLQEHDASKVKE